MEYSLIVLKSKEEDFVISCVMQDNQPWFKGKELTDMLDYQDSNQAIRTHVDKEDQKSIRALDNVKITGSDFKSIFINESGLYSLILSSKKPDAKKFKRWVTNEVLPTLRKAGQYTLPEENIKRYIKYNHELDVHNENDLHYAIVNYLNILIKDHKVPIDYISGMGENLDTESKRIDAFKKGYRRGTPDLMITNKTNKYEGFVLEMKSPTGKGDLSSEQKNILKHYRRQKYKVVISNDLIEIIHKIDAYIDKIRCPCSFCNKRFINTDTRERHHTCFHHKFLDDTVLSDSE
jgi:prophage antirepressor-like protein